ARDLPFRGDHLGGDALVSKRIFFEQRRWEWMAACARRGADGQARHILDARRDGNVADTGLDEVRGEVDRLLARAALAIYGGRGYLDGKAGLQHCVARDVDRLLTDLAHTAHDDVFD